jgi:hypothetical protein
VGPAALLIQYPIAYTPMQCSTSSPGAAGSGEEVANALL